MPVTLTIVNHFAENWRSSRVGTSEKLLELVSPKEHRRTSRVIQSSFDGRLLGENHTSSSPNGFVWAAINAYSSHHHLCIRPEDVWFAIITQVGFYVNAHAESLRSFFVEHEGKKELEIRVGGTMETVDFGALAGAMTHLMAKNVKDPELRTWVMPSFSTTSQTDIAVASVLFMGAMQKYFSYTMRMLCGIPSVTLLGEVADWADILSRLDKLAQLGEEPGQFADMLKPILRNMVLSFTEPSSPAVIRFWNSIADKHQMSGSCTYSGWIAAFCFWNEKGEAQLSPKRCNGTWQAVIDSKNIPAGFCSVPVKVDDNGRVFDCTMIAGSVGIQVRSIYPYFARERRAATSSGDAFLRVIQPLSGWWICENESAKEAEAPQTEIKATRDELITVDKACDAKLQRSAIHKGRRHTQSTARRRDLRMRLSEFSELRY
ncbi:hypothetical protein H634G_08230 [Metarhizium anisopliae BRIP 53293]|uniref:DUF4419 domain-containing protein n=1 Tax=Metarhizium anisopliae BRIP 53293 TaxID=1291518 RepID=A0A0D9NRI9_METAN|nr:hypothetical protein H634G_08230 [Metarhizium anisopliae BRIP 53293]KJK87777.1 hypothetical protein H633G_08383 [Metarhizium anisopliae BRIP 53284]